MGVGYYVSASNDSYTDHGVFTISTGVDNLRVKEVVKAILAELKKMKEDIVPQDELQKAKDYLIGNMFLGLESSDSQAEFCGYQEILKREVKTPDEMAEKLNAVTSEDIKALANLIFTDANLNMALIGRFKSPSAFTKFFKLS